jgi:ADP-heptose:LPS heptosyltransferase
MKSCLYRDKWSTLTNETADQDDLKRLSRQIAYSFLDYYLKDCHYEEEYIDLLCEMTTFSEDPQLNNPGAQALFVIILESLCDDFEELQTVTYNKVMTQVISYCRNIPAGKELDLTLKDFGIYSSQDLLDRITKIRANESFLSPRKCLKKILLLSRVTIGADVAITSVIIQRLTKVFPEAEIVLIGESKLEEVYGGNSRIKIRKISYSRKGGLLERLSSWHLVLQIIREEIASCPLEKTILVDSDSRLSQLGVLPLIPLDNYFFFDSRSDTSLDTRMSMAKLANAWVNKLVGEEEFCYPKVWIPKSYLDCATRFCNRLRNSGAERIIAVNFGVGGNPRKRVRRLLEEKLLLTLLNEPNTVIVLDKGFGEEELVYINSLISSIKNRGYSVIHTLFDSQNNAEINWGIIGVQSRIGEVAALIAKSDEFIGYDSACQHIAAALGTPCLTIFAGSNNMRFIRRWSACGPKSCHIIHVDTLTDPSLIDVDDIITRIMHARKMRTVNHLTRLPN